MKNILKQALMLMFHLRGIASIGGPTVIMLCSRGSTVPGRGEY
jgi:hypothetical protein